MAFIPVLMIATAAISAVGAISAAHAQSASDKSQQQAENYNATVEQQNANAAEGAASANERAQRMSNDQQMGMERARVGESGGGYTGTNVGVLAQNGANLELNALNTRYQGQMQSRGLLAQGTLDQFQGEVAGQNASNAMTGGYLSAAGNAMGSVSNYYNYRSLSSGYGGYGI